MSFFSFDARRNGIKIVIWYGEGIIVFTVFIFSLISFPSALDIPEYSYQWSQRHTMRIHHLQ